MQYDNLKLQTLIKVSPFLFKVYDNGCLLNNTKCTHPKEKNEFKLQGLIFISKHKQILLPNQWWKSIGSPKQFTKLGEGSHVLISGDFGPL